MPQKGTVPDVTVYATTNTDDGDLVGYLRWNRAPGVEFTLGLSPDGRVTSWSAIADAGCSLASRQLRAAPIGAMERALRRHVAEKAEGRRQHHERGDWYDAGRWDAEAGRWRPETPQEKTEHAATEKRYQQWLASFAERPTAGPRAALAVAATYVQALDDGEAHPVLIVAKRLNLAEKTVRNYLFKARETGLLTSVGRGKAGGKLTDKAKEILSGQH